MVFLYDMLKSKKESLNESYKRADQEIQDLLQKVKDSEITVRENLEEDQKRQRVSAGRKAKDASFTEHGQEREETVLTGIEALSRKAAEKNVFGTDQANAGNEVYTEAGISGEENDTAVFQPFAPEKIEAVPKKKATEKTAKKPKGESAEKETDIRTDDTGKKAAGRRGSSGKTSKIKEKLSPENEVTALLVSDFAEDMGTNSNGRILELHRAGKSNMAIARELGLGIGEVKLVIDLYEGLR